MSGYIETFVVDKDVHYGTKPGLFRNTFLWFRQNKCILLGFLMVQICHLHRYSRLQNLFPPQLVLWLGDNSPPLSVVKEYTCDKSIPYLLSMPTTDSTPP